MMNARTKSSSRWTRNELMLAINLYYQIPFGRQHQRAPEVISLARRLGRTPGSVAMKLNNLTSLDPEEAKRGVKGLAGASRLDRSVWNEFHENWEAMAIESEALWEGLVEGEVAAEAWTLNKGVEELHGGKVVGRGQSGVGRIISMPGGAPGGPTEMEKKVRVRLSQNFFRRIVLASYDLKCCISGNPVPDFLIASHILPWSDYPEHRLNPRNGLCLSRLHDAAFDHYLITLDEDYRVVLGKSLKGYFTNESVRLNFAAFEGKRISLPEKHLPDLQFLSVHRERFAKQQ